MGILLGIRLDRELRRNEVVTVVLNGFGADVAAGRGITTSLV